jgi:hydrogenase maturation protease
MSNATRNASPDAPDVLVLGIGNLLWADEGFGVRAVEALHDAYAMPAGVELLDGGTQGLLLLDPVCSARRVLVFDAIDFGLAPGSLRVLRDREVPAWGSTKMSLHQQSFHELLAIADLQGRFPPHLVLIGVQPECLSDFGGSLSAAVKAQLPAAIGHAVAQLGDWGFAPARRAAPAERLNAAALELAAYETGRPSADAACRVGDARFLGIRSANERRTDTEPC